MKTNENLLKCKDMFLDRWKVMEKEIVLEREDGEQRFWKMMSLINFL